MAMLAVEGAEGMADQADWEARWNSNDRGVSVVAGRLRGQAIYLSASSSVVALTLQTAVTTGTIGFAWLASDDGGLGVNIRMVDFMDNGTIQCSLSYRTNGMLRFNEGASTLLGSSRPGLIITGQWYYIEVQVTIDGSVGAYEVRVDGINEISDTSVNTQATANSQFDLCRFNRDNSLDPYIDDMVFMDDAGLTLNDFIGDVEVETVVPDGDGNRTDFTPSTGNNWENVDDGDTPDDDATYNHDTVVGTDDLYTHGALQATQIDTIYGVNVRNFIRKEGAGYRECRSLVRSNVTEDQGPSRAISGTFRYYDGFFELDPDGAAAWDEAAVNAAEFGLELVT